jgi:GcrA cell cycle regulator
MRQINLQTSWFDADFLIGKNVPSVERVKSANGKDSPWNEERIAALRVHWDAGLSCSQIAAQLGNGISRNAVIGKACRLGLDSRKALHRATPVVRKRDRLRIRLITTTERKPARRFRMAPSISDLPPDKSDCAVSLMDLKRNSCRWPLGDPQSSSFMFCGAVQEPDCSYCSRHAFIAFRGAPPASTRAETEIRQRLMAKMRKKRAA